jgi:hypothetical protein
MQFRRGFKSDANWYARSAREILCVNEWDPIDPWKLAEKLAFTIYTIEDMLRMAPQASIAGLLVRASQQFSAVRVKLPDGENWIVHNELHGRKRQAANICHELAHAYLMHPMDRMIDNSGQRSIDEAHEREATWLGPALLVSEESAVHIVRQGWSVEEASDRYGASGEVIRMRLNVTGAFRRVKAA